jgi:hypothetical protein
MRPGWEPEQTKSVRSAWPWCMEVWRDSSERNTWTFRVTDIYRGEDIHKQSGLTCLDQFYETEEQAQEEAEMFLRRVLIDALWMLAHPECYGDSPPTGTRLPA